MTRAVWPSPADSPIDGMRQKATLDPVSKAKLTVPSVATLFLLSGFNKVWRTHSVVRLRDGAVAQNEGPGSHSGFDVL